MLTYAQYGAASTVTVQSLEPDCNATPDRRLQYFHQPPITVTGTLTFLTPTATQTFPLFPFPFRFRFGLVSGDHKGREQDCTLCSHGSVRDAGVIFERNFWIPPQTPPYHFQSGRVLKNNNQTTKRTHTHSLSHIHPRPYPNEARTVASTPSLALPPGPPLHLTLLYSTLPFISCPWGLIRCAAPCVGGPHTSNHRSGTVGRRGLHRLGSLTACVCVFG